MANTTTPRSANYNGWYYDAVTPAMKFYNRGTLVVTSAASAALTFAGDTTISGAGTTTGNHTFTSTITAGADGVGSDSEQLTSGGSGAGCDWATA